MSLTDTEQLLALAKMMTSTQFPLLDAALRSGRHISDDEIELHAFLLEYEHQLDQFYQRYAVELIRAPEGFFYLRPKASALLGRGVLSALEMMVGKVLCYLYLSPDKLANEGVFSTDDLREELQNLVDESQLVKLVNQRGGNTDLDRRKLYDKINASLRRLRRLGMVSFIEGTSKFRVHNSIFRFGAEVRADEDPAAVLLRLIQQGEAVQQEADSDDSDFIGFEEDSAEQQAMKV